MKKSNFSYSHKIKTLSIVTAKTYKPFSPNNMYIEISQQEASLFFFSDHISNCIHYEHIQIVFANICLHLSVSKPFLIHLQQKDTESDIYLHYG